MILYQFNEGVEVELKLYLTLHLADVDMQDTCLLALQYFLREWHHQWYSYDEVQEA